MRQQNKLGNVIYINIFRKLPSINRNQQFGSIPCPTLVFTRQVSVSSAPRRILNLEPPTAKLGACASAHPCWICRNKLYVFCNVPSQDGSESRSSVIPAFLVIPSPLFLTVACHRRLANFSIPALAPRSKDKG